MVQFFILVAIIGLFIGYVMAIKYPAMFDTASSYLDAVIYYISQGLDLLWLFLPKTLTLSLAGLAVTIEIIYLGYRLLMWIIKLIGSVT